MQLVGGDTTRGPLSLTLAIHGLVPVNRQRQAQRATSGIAAHQLHIVIFQQLEQAGAEGTFGRKTG
jgi:hypothetical protein